MDHLEHSHAGETSQGRALGLLAIVLLVLMAGFALLLFMGTMQSFS